MRIPEKVLITQGQLVNYSGSEIITLELAEHLSALGVEVTILTHFLAAPISSEFKKLENVRIVVAGDDDARDINLEDFGLLWVHHMTLTPSLVRQLAGKGSRPAVVFHHMSKSEPLEFPILYETENKLADVVAFNSRETYEDLRKRGAEFDQSKVFVLGNPAPDVFAGIVHNPAAEARKVAVVSNHPPKEVIDAATMLRQRGLQVDMIGRMDTGTAKRVTPEILSSYDAVVSIGKTVQYCIVGGIPVYCYDRFGGPGFLTPGNFALSRENNFSGRGFGEKTAGQITEEIVGQFSTAAEDIRTINQKYGKEFLLSQRLQELMEVIDEAAASRRDQSRLDAIEENALVSYAELMGKFTHSLLRWKTKATAAEAEVSRLRAANKQLAEETNRLRAELSSKGLTRAGRAVKATIKKLID